MKKQLKKFNHVGLLESLLKHPALISVAVVLAGFLVGTLLLMMVGKSPGQMYSAILMSFSGFNTRTGGFNPRYVGVWLTISMPLILTGLSMGFAFRSGLFNIGAEGQYIMGLTAAQYFAFTLPAIPGVTVILCVLAGAMAGAIWSGIVGFFRGKYQVSEVVLTIMLNYVALFFSRWFSRNFLPGTNTFRSANFPSEAMLTNDFFMRITNNSPLHNGIFFVLVALILYHIIMERTTLGFALRAGGFNPTAARFAGMAPVRSVVIAMAISGALAGLAGAIVSQGNFEYGRILQNQDQYGFTGIAVGLVAGGSALGTLFSGLLFGMLTAASPLMQSRGIPKEIAGIISGLVVIFIAVKGAIIIYLGQKVARDKAKKKAAHKVSGFTAEGETK